MCGIIGYIGSKQALNILISGLSKLEYRGYDSAGIGIITNHKIKIIKNKGELTNLINKLGDQKITGNLGIGHTRWATHGAPSSLNAHPHISQNGKIAIIHNGIIENYLSLKKELESKGYKFKTETDSEVIANLLEYYQHSNFLISIQKTVKRLKGSFALGIINENYPDTLYAVRNESPLIVGTTSNEQFIASDIPAIINWTKEIYYLDNLEIAVLTKNQIKFYNIKLQEIQKYLSKITWDNEEAAKHGYKHFMIKEIFEQRKAIANTINPRIKNNMPLLDINITKQELNNVNKIYVIACGTSYYAGLNAKPLMEQLLNITTEVDLASEFRYRQPLIDNNSLVIIISQSGETADTLAALRLAKEKNAKTIAIVNVVGSTIAREADQTIYTWAGPEIAVASTKAYTTQLAIIYLLTIKLANLKGKVKKKELINLVKTLQLIPDQVNEILTQNEKIRALANEFYKEQDIYFIGRNIDYYTALEGALKLKEISYIHAEAYAAGELKHGTIALIEEGTLVVSLCTNKELYPKMINNIKEITARGAKTLVITNNKDEVGDYHIFIPPTNPYFNSILSVIPLQLFAYHMANNRNCNIDKPKNLAKSVTVE
ncbi:MAG: glutamine--fructose-6-phosphate transaminase (isomerizing) [Bacilli bacterium]|nr:glutamine--fructose-6-phosphate transaminase (isomerizing) [Bacilli bacterium]